MLGTVRNNIPQMDLKTIGAIEYPGNYSQDNFPASLN